MKANDSRSQKINKKITKLRAKNSTPERKKKSSNLDNATQCRSPKTVHYN